MGPGPQHARDHLALLASAMASRRMAVAPSGCDEAWTDGQTVFVPDADHRDQLTALVVQAALVAAGSLSPRVVVRLVGRRATAARYLALEVRRAVSLLGYAAPRSVADAASVVGQLPLTGTAEESLRLAIADESIPESPPLFGVLRPRKVVGIRAAAFGRASGTARDDAAERTDEPDLIDEDVDAEPTWLQKLLLEASGGSNPLARALQLFGSGRSGESENGDGGAEVPVGGRRAASEIGAHAKLVTVAPALGPAGDDHRPPGSATYPEWDWERQRYRPAFCRISEFDSPAVDGTDRLRLTPDPALRRSLARLGLALARHDRRADGEALDLRALVDFGVDRATGHAPDDRVYETRLRTAHDLGVVLLLDASGSTAESGEAGSVWDEQRRLAANLVTGLEQVGDRVAAYGFRSHGADDVRFLPLKDFDGRFDAGAVARLDALKPAGFTRLGAAIRHASAIATARAGTSRLLLVLVSDGVPYEQGYEGRYAREDTKRALAEAVQVGVGCVCMSVGSSTSSEDLEAVWGDVTYLRMADPIALGARAEPLFRAALHAALEGSHGSRR